MHAFVNDLERPVGTYLYGRRMYEVMVGWETRATSPTSRPVVQRLRADLAGGRQDRVLHDAGGGIQRQDADRARLRPGSGPADESDGRDATSPWAVPISPPRRIRAGLVDECHLFVDPVVVGGGKPFLPAGVRMELELLDERRFGNGVVHLHYRVAG